MIDDGAEPGWHRESYGRIDEERRLDDEIDVRIVLHNAAFRCGKL